MSQTLTDILVVIAAVFLVWLVIRLFRKPIRWILKLLLNTAIGFAALFLLNFFGSAIGITLAAPYSWTLPRENYNDTGTWPELSQSTGTPG